MKDKIVEILRRRLNQPRPSYLISCTCGGERKCNCSEEFMMQKIADEILALMRETEVEYEWMLLKHRENHGNEWPFDFSVGGVGFYVD